MGDETKANVTERFGGDVDNNLAKIRGKAEVRVTVSLSEGAARDGSC